MVNLEDYFYAPCSFAHFCFVCSGNTACELKIRTIKLSYRSNVYEGLVFSEKTLKVQLLICIAFCIFCKNNVIVKCLFFYYTPQTFCNCSANLMYALHSDSSLFLCIIEAKLLSVEPLLIF